MLDHVDVPYFIYAGEYCTTHAHRGQVFLLCSVGGQMLGLRMEGTLRIASKPVSGFMEVKMKFDEWGVTDVLVGLEVYEGTYSMMDRTLATLLEQPGESWWKPYIGKELSVWMGEVSDAK